MPLSVFRFHFSSLKKKKSSVFQSITLLPECTVKLSLSADLLFDLSLQHMVNSNNRAVGLNAQELSFKFVLAVRNPEGIFTERIYNIAIHYMSFISVSNFTQRGNTVF